MPLATEKCSSGQSQACCMWQQCPPLGCRKTAVQGGRLSSGAWGAGSGSHLWFWLEKTKSPEANRCLHMCLSNSSYHWSRCHEGGSSSPTDNGTTFPKRPSLHLCLKKQPHPSLPLSCLFVCLFVVLFSYHRSSLRAGALFCLLL